VGYVAQGFSLYPHLSVWQNLLFATGATPELAAYWLEHLRLEGLEDRYPSELSGGQRQRVALAQVLCRSPQILLLDEPFSSLDVPVRLELRRELRRLQRETGLATVLVSHDPEEAAFLSDEVLVIANGRALQSGTSREVFSRPASAEVARLLGIANLHQATVVSPGLIDAHGARIETDTGDASAGAEVLWSIRPERVMIARAPNSTQPGDVPSGTALLATVTDIADVGTAVDFFVALNADLELQARLPEPIDLEVGASCSVKMAPEAISLWPAPESIGPAPFAFEH
jgi:molybdate transport system permease protein